MNQEERIEYFMAEIARLSNQVVDLQDERDALAAQNAELSRLLFAAEKQTAQLTLITLGELSLNKVRADAVLDALSACAEFATVVADYHTERHESVEVCFASDIKQHAASILAGKE